jgi:hypothetical protein
MTGWMIYPSNRCLECDRYDYEADDCVNSPADTCKFLHDDCPLWEDEGEEGSEE